ncbi:MAG TPA: hypothetical protein VK809_12260 [Bacteroidia bacterium]|jgi:hypothetical protein|nr:hypothetical protein [Bacteroidia bacterium]
MKTKGYTLRIAFGKEVADALNYGRALTKDEISMSVKKYEFGSENEAKSLLFGISESMGWFDYYIMDELDIQNLNKKWLKEIEVQQVP